MKNEWDEKKRQANIARHGVGFKESHPEIPRRVRGPQKEPKKVLVSVRYSPEVIEYFKSTGPGWQARMDDVLREYVESHQ